MCMMKNGSKAADLKWVAERIAYCLHVDDALTYPRNAGSLFWRAASSARNSADSNELHPVDCFEGKEKSKARPS
jgi:hypothetical protein